MKISDEIVQVAAGAYRDGATHESAIRAALSAVLPKLIVNADVDVATVRRKALDALKKAEQFIENGVEFGFIKLPDSDDPSLETLPKIKEAIRALSAEPAPETGR